MASIVIPRIMVRGITWRTVGPYLKIRKYREDAVLHSMHGGAPQEEHGALRVYRARGLQDTSISLSAIGRDVRCYPDDHHHDLQDHGVSHYTRWPAS